MGSTSLLPQCHSLNPGHLGVCPQRVRRASRFGPKLLVRFQEECEPEKTLGGLHCLLPGRPWASRRAQKAIGALPPFLGDPGRATGLRRQSGHCPPSWETLGELQTLGKPQGSEGNWGTAFFPGRPWVSYRAQKAIGALPSFLGDPGQASGLRRQSGH